MVGHINGFDHAALRRIARVLHPFIMVGVLSGSTDKFICCARQMKSLRLIFHEATI